MEVSSKYSGLPLHKVLILLCMFLYGFHLLRNIYFAYTFISGLFPLVAIFLYALGSAQLTCDRKGVKIIAIFLLGSLLPILYSFYWFPDIDYTMAIARYLYMYPFVIFMIFVIKNIEDYVYTLKVISVLVVFCGLSIFYQVITGHAVDWFAAASERAGLARYSSLLGSLGGFGSIAPCALPIVVYLYKSRLLKSISCVIIIGALLLTLQKSGVANIIILSIMFFFYGSKRGKLLLVAVVLFSSIALYFINSQYVNTNIGNVFFHSDGYESADVEFSYSVLQRLWLLPSILFNSYGIPGILLGVGLVGGGGVFGLSGYPMAHNAFFDLLFTGGVINLLLFIWFAVYIYLSIKKSKVYSIKEKLAKKTSMTIFILLMINFPMGIPVYFQPYGGMFFYLLACYYLQWIRKE